MATMRNKLFMTFLAAIAVCSGVEAGTLRLGAATYDGDTVTLPVVLDGDIQGGASTIAFSVKYDDRVLEPVASSAGPAATAADKLVQSNLPAPGEYKVIMLGMNQTPLTSGEIATITLKIKEAGAGQSEISITNTSFASPEGTEIPSQGSSQTLKLDESQGSGDENPQNDRDEQPDEQTDQPANDEETPDSPDGSDDGGGEGVPAVPGSIPATPDSSYSSPNAADAGRAPQPGKNDAGGSAAPAQVAKAGGNSPSARIADAMREAESKRAAISTPASPDATATAPATTSGGSSVASTTASGTEPMASTDGAPVDAGSVQSAAQPTQTARASESRSATATGSVPAAVLPVTEAGSPAAAGGASPAASGGGNTTKFVIIGVIVVVIGVLFFVRKKLVS